MRLSEKLKNITAQKRMSEFTGVTIIEEFDIKTGKVVKRFEKKNTLTGLIYGLFGRANFNNSIPCSELLPVHDKLFGGIICTNEENDADEMCIASNAEVTACADNTAYTSDTPSARGSFSAENSGFFEDENGHGYQNCWTWTDIQGFENNGVIKSVGLTLASLGSSISSISDSSVPSTEATMDKRLTAVDINSKTPFKDCHIYDYDNNRAYRFDYDSTSGSEAINIKVYELNTDVYHLGGSYLNVGRELTDEEFSVSVVLNKAYFNLCWEQATGHAYVVNFTAYTGNIDIVDINLASKTGTKTAHTFSDVQITWNLNNNSFMTGGYCNFGMFISNGYFYCISHSFTKIMKCNLSSDVDVVDVDNPLKTIADWNSLGAFVELKNGDFLWTASSDDRPDLCRWYHNGTWRLCRWTGTTSYGQVYTKMFMTKYGTIIGVTGSNYNPTVLTILVAFPYLCTVNNLVDEEHPDGYIRTVGLGLRILYKIYEEEPSEE